MKKDKLFGPLFMMIALSEMAAGCGDQAQEAAENANKDTVPVIETKPEENAAPGGSADSVKTDSAAFR